MAGAKTHPLLLQLGGMAFQPVHAPLHGPSRHSFYGIAINNAAAFLLPCRTVWRSITPSTATSPPLFTLLARCCSRPAAVVLLASVSRPWGAASKPNGFGTCLLGTVTRARVVAQCAGTASDPYWAWCCFLSACSQLPDMIRVVRRLAQVVLWPSPLMLPLHASISPTPTTASPATLLPGGIQVRLSTPDAGSATARCHE